MKKIFAFLLALLLLISSWAALAETVKLAYSSGSLKLRKGAGTKYAANGVVKNGDNITVLSKGKVWTKVRTDDNREGTCTFRVWATTMPTAPLTTPAARPAP